MYRPVRILAMTCLFGLSALQSVDMARADWFTSACTKILGSSQVESAIGQFSWIEAGPNIDLKELKDLNTKSHSGQMSYLTKEYGIKFVLRGGVSTLKEALNAQFGGHWNSFLHVINTPWVELKSLKEAHNFYTRDWPQEHYGLYLAPNYPWVFGQAAPLIFDRPYVGKHVILLPEKYFNVALLHEFLHFKISSKIIADKPNLSFAGPRADLVFKMTDDYTRFASEPSPSPSRIFDYQLEDALNSAKAIELAISEELAINQLLLQYHRYLGLSASDLDQLLGVYIRDGIKGMQISLKIDDEITNGWNPSPRQRRLRKSAEEEVQKIRMYFATGFTRFFDVNHDLARRAIALGILSDGGVSAD